MSSLALEAQRMVRDAAQPISPGETIKSQRRRAARALGYRDGDWRIRTAWYGEAGSWSALAFEELRGKHAAWEKRRAACSQEKVATYGVANAALADRLETLDPEFYRLEIARLRNLVERLGGQTD